MSNLKEIRTRIASVQSTKKITSAMKMVAAAKLKKAQDAVINLRPYANKLQELLVDIAQSIGYESVKSEYFRKPPKEGANVLLVVISSNKGLCGSFNANIIKKTDETLARKYPNEHKEKNVSIYSIGKKGTEHFQSHDYPLYDSDDDVLESTTYKKLLPCINKVMDAFINKEFDIVEIVYNKFKNAAVQLLTLEQFLPVELDLGEQKEINHHNYIFEPSREYIVQEMIPKSLRTHFYEAILESLAAEHGARMTAMHKATDNATDLIKELRLKYNKARQAAITTEISEVVSGAEALRQ